MCKMVHALFRSEIVNQLILVLIDRFFTSMAQDESALAQQGLQPRLTQALVVRLEEKRLVTTATTFLTRYKASLTAEKYYWTSPAE